LEISFLLLASSNLLCGQQLPVFSSFSLTDAYQNPSTLVIPKTDDIQLFYSNSSPGFSDAPHSYLIGYAHPFKNNTFLGPSYSDSKNNYNKASNAIGGYLLYDKYGEMQQLSAMVGYAQSFAISDNLLVSLGMSAGIYNFKIDYSDLIIKNQSDNTYSRYINQQSNFTFFDANFGLIARYRNFKLEASINQFLRDRALISAQDLQSEIYETSYFGFSTQQKLSKSTNLISKLYFQKTGALPSWIGLNNSFIFNERWLGGLIYNHKRNVGVELGMIFQSYIIQYSFLLNTNSYNIIGYTNHNLGFRYSFSAKNKIRFEDYF
jgi:type IX secretion system PorP/SprF family membrane protein